MKAQFVQNRIGAFIVYMSCGVQLFSIQVVEAIFDSCFSCFRGDSFSPVFAFDAVTKVVVVGHVVHGFYNPFEARPAQELIGFFVDDGPATDAVVDVLLLNKLNDFFKLFRVAHRVATEVFVHFGVWFQFEEAL